MTHSAGHNAGAGQYTIAAFQNTAATAAGSGDNTTVTGNAVDITALSARYNAAVLSIGSVATMASGESLAVTALVQTSANNSDWSTLVASQTVYTHTASGGAATAAAAGGDVSVDLSKAYQYIRCAVKPDLSRAGTDTATIAGTWALHNPDRITASNA